MRLIDAEWLSNAIHNFFSGKISATSEEDIQAYINATPTICDIEQIRAEVAENGNSDINTQTVLRIIDKHTKGAEE